MLQKNDMSKLSSQSGLCCLTDMPTDAVGKVGLIVPFNAQDASIMVT